MKMYQVLEAEAEAERFLAKVRALKERVEFDKDIARYWGITGCRESGAVKRASLDLSAALTDMRR